MRSTLTTAVLAWVTAVLVTSPVLAARNCLECCGERTKSPAATVPACPHCPTTDAATMSVAGETCHGCPKCESSRPSPVTPVSPVEHWTPTFEFADVVWSALPTVVNVPSPTARWEFAPGRVPHPPLQVLYCTWLN